MQRYFLATENFKGDLVRLTGDEAHHIARVMRMAADDQIICCNESGKSAIVELTQVEKEEVYGRIRQWLDENSELPVEVTLAQGLPKGDKLEMIIQKATELGVTAITPVAMARSIVKLDPKKAAKKQERWKKIAKEAAEQSHRQRVPEIQSVQTLKELIKQAGPFDLVLAAYEEEGKSGNHEGLPELLSGVQEGSRILFVIGPEGGFSSEEIVMLKDAGIFPVSLGPRILRTETAGLYSLSVLSYHFELLR
ncbi:16S rRNA (uracil(1498)-N(3))-methyltransferase [Salisediminibacterium beveridgei]|uniref:Ribosomal RNA small subunit methyltransferase E n=1 Tax=Salisediminibacterium beveridgei TaxID=632773 RepID=A0A1D7QU93_9BACI|nr:16S rRNA (uracil(1498)-N(3))-methyltransferase [Salisediminibacterium beveridgei]AOM82581.1 Ribosomal RNA small subunit methyltransferase E [Salisediminibacterium beveridgei]